MSPPSSAVDYLQRSFSWTTDLIFPPRCIACNRFSVGSSHLYLCKRCQRTVRIRQSSECIGCKAPSSLGELCPDCRPNFHLDRLHIATHFSDPLVQKCIETFKYRFIRELGVPLSRFLTTHCGFLQKKKSYNIFQNNPLIVPVPLHPYRYNWRGFNQSEILATTLGNMFQLEHDATMLLRTKKTAPQAATDDKQHRIQNVFGIFQCVHGEKVKNRHILLVDDVCTSGATLNECARILKEAGAASVTGLVVARG